MKADSLKAPFPYFGGKSMIADKVWKALGQPDHYMEPFFGSGAVLLNRHDYDESKHTETVCDADGFISNVWRAIQYDPQGTAKVCDWPVNHADLIARKARLIREENYLLENLCKDDKWFDTELAGYWIWAAGCWIGSGMTSPNDTSRPHLTGKGQGVHVVGKRPALANKGIGVHAVGQIPSLGSKGMGIHKTNRGIYDWFDRLSARLRRVRVVCGDWSRICGGDWQAGYWKTVGMFFDPPYSVDDRASVYHKESLDVARDVVTWSIPRGERESYRIVIAGYSDEHPELVEAGWRTEAWKAAGGYGNVARLSDSKARGKANRHREMLYYSPYCLDQLGMFDFGD